MSLHHSVLADVWTILQERPDIASILREIIGQRAIATNLIADDDRNAQDSNFEAIIWIKIILDLQRSYLSGLANGVLECPPQVNAYLLPKELVFTTILYLINTKSQITLQVKDSRRARLILAQAVLSGLRLLLQRKDRITKHEKQRLHIAINTAWQHDRIQGVESFVVSDVFSQILDSLESPTRDVNDTHGAYTQEWLNARL